MNTEQLEKVAYRFTPEVAVIDSEERIVLLARTKGAIEEYGNVSEVISWLRDANGAISFTMFVDLEKIQIFKWDSPNLSAPVCTLNTADILGHYGLDVNNPWLSSDSVGSRVNSWIGDLDYHWNSEKPPGEEAIAAIGLLPLLRNGFRQPEVQIRIDPKFRYMVLRYYSRLDTWDEW